MPERSGICRNKKLFLRRHLLATCRNPLARGSRQDQIFSRATTGFCVGTRQRMEFLALHAASDNRETCCYVAGRHNFYRAICRSHPVQLAWATAPSHGESAQSRKFFCAMSGRHAFACCAGSPPSHFRQANYFRRYEDLLTRYAPDRFILPRMVLRFPARANTYSCGRSSSFCSAAVNPAHGICEQQIQEHKNEGWQDRLAPVLGTIELHRDKTFTFHQPHHFRIQHLQREHAAPGTRKF